MSDNTLMKANEEFGRRFRQAVDYAGYKDLSIRKLAEKLGVAHTSVDRWNRGEQTPSIERQVKIADHCGVDVGWLLTGRGVMTDDPAIKIFAQIMTQMDDVQRKEVFNYAAYVLERGSDKASREDVSQSRTVDHL